MSNFKNINASEFPVSETIRVKGNTVTLDLLVISGKDGDYYVAISPSANISGYGLTEEEAYESFDHNATEFGYELLALPNSERDKAIRALGFTPQKYKTKNFSKSFVDSNGVLQNFEPGTVKTNKLQTAFAA